MIPFQFKDKSQPVMRKETWSLWFKVAFACLPGAIVTILFDDYIEAHLHTAVVIALALIFYGIAFVLIENWNKRQSPRVNQLTEITYRLALFIGLFQVLSIIPGTSRSGATIIGALLLGVSRIAAAEFTFFLAVPVMFGLSAIKIYKFGLDFTSAELFTLGLGMVVAFIVSILVIKFLMSYIKKHDFKVFGWYRIALGIVVLLLFMGK
ncbi:Undecaprenyl-diphosphatase [compost metagenome]